MQHRSIGHGASEADITSPSESVIAASRPAREVASARATSRRSAPWLQRASIVEEAVRSSSSKPAAADIAAIGAAPADSIRHGCPIRADAANPGRSENEHVDHVIRHDNMCNFAETHTCTQTHTHIHRSLRHMHEGAAGAMTQRDPTKMLCGSWAATRATNNSYNASAVMSSM